jgi:hypothetical protein
VYLAVPLRAEALRVRYVSSAERFFSGLR